MMKRVLFISYFFPPDGGGGTQRPAKFCKYLPQFGWQPLVLTRGEPAQRTLWDPEDVSLAAQIGDETRVVRVQPDPSPRGWAAAAPSVDITRTWLANAYDRAAHIVETERPDVVLISMSPFDLCFLGQRLAREIGVPVIYDLRDPWALDGWRLHGTKARWRLDHRAMIATLSTADGIIANTPESAKALQAAAPNMDPSRMTTITNGFDAEDFTEPVPERSEADGFRLVHTGTLHSSILYKYEGPLGFLRRLRHYRAEPIRTSGRTALHLLRAMKLLKQRAHPFAGRILFEHIGPVDEATRRCVAESGMADQVVFAGYQPHRESTLRVRTADALFLPLHGLPPGRRSLIVPGKAYEYLAAGRPILGCLPEGDARDWVLESGRGVCADPCDEQAIAEALVSLIEGKVEPAVDAASEPWLQRFERRRISGDLADFLNRIADTSGNGGTGTT